MNTEFLNITIKNKLIPMVRIAESIGITKSEFTKKLSDKYPTKKFSDNELTTLRTAINDILAEKQAAISSVLALTQGRLEIIEALVKCAENMFIKTVDKSSPDKLILTAEYAGNNFNIYIYADSIELFSVEKQQKVSSFGFDEVERVIEYIINY